MSLHPPSLAGELARLRLTAQAEPAPLWLPDAVHALIIALFVRLFSRLEELARLWQAGLLPPPSPRAAPARPRLAAAAETFETRPPHRRHPAETCPAHGVPTAAPRRAAPTGKDTAMKTPFALAALALAPLALALAAAQPAHAAGSLNGLGTANGLNSSNGLSTTNGLNTANRLAAVPTAGTRAISIRLPPAR